MELSDLQIFRCVVEEGRISKAALKLHRMQSNVTTRIRQLEQELGVSLFLREGKRLLLTASSRILLGYADWRTRPRYRFSSAAAALLRILCDNSGKNT